MKYRANVVGIDFGASYTKLAYRFFDSSHESPIQSRPLRIEQIELIPTLAIELNRKEDRWVFGKQAAAWEPGSGTVIHRNWKSRLLRPDGETPDENALEIARNFFRWLLDKLSKPGILPFDPLDAAVMICVPAFKESGEAFVKLGSVMESAGWRNKLILRTTEPKANTIGYCTEGRNVTNWHGLDWGEMFGLQSPFINFTRQHLTDNEVAMLAVLDIGSFTSDLSLITWRSGATEDYLSEGSQHSYRHGIVAQLDALCLPQVLDDVGESIEELPFDQLEVVKKHLYRGEAYELGGYTIGDESHQELINSALDNFAEELWQQIEPVIRSHPIKWFLLTGGGAAIPRIKKQLDVRFESIRAGSQRPRRLVGGGESRNATAIGATSIILATQTGYFNEPKVLDPPRIEPLPPLQSCTCHGSNKNCIRCGGSEVIQFPPAAPRSRPQLIDAAPKPLDTTPSLESGPDLEAEDVTSPDEPLDPIYENVRYTDREIAEHTLEGWLGNLVFGSNPGTNEHNYRHFRSILESNDINMRNRSWYRLLCVACALGSRVPRRTIQTFWQTTLEQTGFWEATTGSHQNSARLDKFFEDLIHREYRSIYAAGEQAELLRRVFYDFRKLHFLTYENNFASVILEVLGGIGEGTNPVLFLRSGALPDGGMWKGVIGHSMTSPLLFLMREWRRAGLISSNRMDHYCFYMNTAARRGACRKGWLNWEQLYAYSLPEILESSSKVYEKLSESEEWSLADFDIPLQIIGSRRGRKRT